MKTCPKCSTTHEKPGIYCCRSCANSRCFSEESIQRKSATLKNTLTSLSPEQREARRNVLTSPEVQAKIRNTRILTKQQRLAGPFELLGKQLRRKIVVTEQQAKCLHCESSEWMGHPIKFELDHIDGNTSNNTRSNLRALCPNCHSLTPTWRRGSRNALPAADVVINAYNTTNNMQQLLDKLGLKWGSSVQVLKVLKKSGIII